MTTAARASRAPDARWWLLGMALACIAALAAALVSQYVYDMRPCPWCILQRAIYIVIAALCVLAAAVPALRTALTALALVFTGLGVASAIYQHVVATKQFSCNLTLADRIISALRLETLMPALFQVTASCAEAAVSMLGVPYEYWSLALFALLGAAALLALRGERVPSPSGRGLG
jgi:protein dithiol:quinone oxidoreductase